MISVCEPQKPAVKNDNTPLGINGRSVRFIRRQVEEVREGGLLVALRKGATLLSELREVLSFILFLPLTLPVVIIVRLLTPVVTIRFGQLSTSRIGHFAGETEVYLCKHDLGMMGDKFIDIFYHNRVVPVCNRQLDKMWSRTKGKGVYFCDFAYHVDKLNHLIPGAGKNMIPAHVFHGMNFYVVTNDTGPHLSFTKEEEEAGRAVVRGWGVPEGGSFMCFHARDPVYLKNALKHTDFRYHDYRNWDINRCIPALEELAGKGCFAFRMGAVVDKALPGDNPRIIDYAAKYRSDFLDIYLGAKCLFYLGDPCGYAAIPLIFRRPLALVNFVPFKEAPSGLRNSLFIPKKFWLKAERRFLTYREIVGSEVGKFQAAELYERFGVELVENSAEEIIALALEMYERLTGNWRGTEADEEMQRRFWALFDPAKADGAFLSRIGTEFLRMNRQLMD